MEEYSQDILSRGEVSRGIDSEMRMPGGQENFAYELLLLQQRLFAYEQLHQEEMAELRQEIERLRCVFLQETNPQLRALAPNRKMYIRE